MKDNKHKLSKLSKKELIDSALTRKVSGGACSGCEVCEGDTCTGECRGRDICHSCDHADCYYCDGPDGPSIF
jgi:hypothetical protein